ncbi:MAG: DUF1572 family protein [Chloroflexi bacterium]|nr:DUF1572 family protein [Chloroflexota bacterium]
MCSFIESYKADIISQYRAQKEMADAALARISDRAFFERLGTGDDHTNSVAILVKHLGGNLRSRWADFLTTDGEKPDRYREREFIAEADETRAGIMQRWEIGWQTLFDALASLSPADFDRTITIRGEPHSIVQALHRNLLHAAHHIGQIDLLATLLHDRGG